MKNTTFNDMFEMAVDEFEIDLSVQKPTFKLQTIEKFRETSKNNPRPGSRSYYAKARVPTKNKGKTATRYFSEVEARAIINLQSEYLRRYSSNPMKADKELYANLISKANAVEEKLAQVPTREEERARLIAESEYRERWEAEVVRSSFEYEYGREPNSIEELVEFRQSNNFSFSYDLEEEEAVDLDPVPLSQEEIDKYRNDPSYMAVWGHFYDPTEPPAIVAFEKISREAAEEQAKAKEASMKKEAVFDFLYDMFFKPVKHTALVDDIYRTLNEDEFHHDLAYFEAKQRLESYSFYCERNDSINTLGDDLLTALSSYIKDLVSEVASSGSDQRKTIKGTNIFFSDPKDCGKK